MQQEIAVILKCSFPFTYFWLSSHTMLGNTRNPDAPININCFDHAKCATISEAFCNSIPSFSRKDFAFLAVRVPLFWSPLICLPRLGTFLSLHSLKVQYPISIPKVTNKLQNFHVFSLQVILQKSSKSAFK